MGLWGTLPGGLGVLRVRLWLLGTGGWLFPLSEPLGDAGVTLGDIRPAACPPGDPTVTHKDMGASLEAGGLWCGSFSP